MNYLPRVVLYILILVVILTAGCTQPEPNQQPTISPTPTSAESSLKEPSPQMTRPALSESGEETDTEILKRGTADPDFIVDISVPEKMSAGTTILPDNHDAAHPRIIEVNRLGEIVWEYPLPDNLKSYTNPGWDVEVLENGNILTVLPGNGVYEINRNKQVVWKYQDAKVSHDADRLPNGNTLIAFGSGDRADDAQVQEIDPAGNPVWSWYAKDVFSESDYTNISKEGWTHTNAVLRLDSGNTLISLRNFNVIAEVDSAGNLVQTRGEGVFEDQHDSVILPDGNLLLANHGQPNEVIELEPDDTIIWLLKF